MPINKAGVKGESGFTLIDLLFTASLICTLCTMALPSLLRASQLSFAVTCGSGFYAPTFPMLGIAPPGSVAAFLPADLSSGVSFVKQGYRFDMAGTALAGAPATCNGQPAGSVAPGYAVLADPLDPLGNPHFFGSNADGTIYEHTASLAGWMPESGPPAVGTPTK